MDFVSPRSCARHRISFLYLSMCHEFLFVNTAIRIREAKLPSKLNICINNPACIVVHAFSLVSSIEWRLWHWVARLQSLDIVSYFYHNIILININITWWAIEMFFFIILTGQNELLKENLEFWSCKYRYISRETVWKLLGVNVYVVLNM